MVRLAPRMSKAFPRLIAGLAAAELPIVVLLAPALLFPSPTRLLVVLVVPLVWLCHRRIGGHLIPATPLNASLLLLLGMVAISLAATFDISFSLGKVSGVVLGVLVFWAITRWVTTPARLAAATVAFLSAGAGLAILGLLGINWASIFPAFDAIIERLPKAIRGVPGAKEGFHRNAVAGCLVLFVPLQVALLVGGAHCWVRPWRLSGARVKWVVVIQALLLMLTAGTLLLTQSRGAWVALVVATFVFLAWHSWITRALAAAVAGGVIVTASAVGPERFINLAIRQAGPGMAGYVSGRMELWSRAIYGIQDFPFTGMGMNAFRKVMPVLYPTFLTSPDVDVAHAHNHLLQSALDLGISGLIAYSAIWLTAAVLLVNVYRRSPTRIHRVLAGGLGAGLIAHFSFGLTDAIPLGAKVGVLFWLTLALTVALHKVALSPQSAS